jgi:hypothetical protein
MTFIMDNIQQFKELSKLQKYSNLIALQLVKQKPENECL